VKAIAGVAISELASTVTAILYLIMILLQETLNYYYKTACCTALYLVVFITLVLS
jgi:hypothetical protein